MRIVAFLAVSFILLHCKHEVKHEQAGQVVSLPEAFLSFYEQFHQDSAFQMEHIVFPLAGSPSHPDTASTAGSFYWQRENWRIHKAFDPSNETFVQSFERIGDDMVVDRISTPDGSMYMERRFANMADGWNLIYFADLRYSGYE